jgi:multiple sugar transport system ATP-binding protein
VRENLVLNLEVRRIARQEIEQRVHEVSRMLGLGELLKRRPGQLSGGQRQRVALGRALIRRPNIFLMDEPLSNLDLKLRERTRTELKKLHERLRVTTIYVTHDQAEALVLSDRIGIMNAGELLQVGTPQKIYDEPADIFVAKFVGSPSINLLPVTAEASDGWLKLSLGPNGRKIGGVTLPARPHAAARIMQADGLVLGVRPESITPLHAAAPETTQALIDVVEPMGSVNHLILRLDGVDESTADGEPLVAVVRSDQKFEQGTATWLAIRPDRLMLFQAGAGKALAALSSAGEWQCL